MFYLITNAFHVQTVKERILFEGIRDRIADPERGTLRKTEDGILLPLHLHQSATQPYLPTNADLSNISCVFRVAYDDLRIMDKTTVRNIFRRRHILVTGTPLLEDWLWNEECMSLLGPLDKYVPVQSKSQVPIYL